MDLTPEDRELMAYKKKGRKVTRTPEEIAQRKKEYDRQYAKVRQDKPINVRLNLEMYQILESITRRTGKTQSAIMKEALLIYNKTV